MCGLSRLDLVVFFKPDIFLDLILVLICRKMLINSLPLRFFPSKMPEKSRDYNPIGFLRYFWPQKRQSLTPYSFSWKCLNLLQFLSKL